MVEERKSTEISTDDFIARMQARLAQYDTVSIKKDVDSQVSAFKASMDKMNDTLVSNLSKHMGAQKEIAQLAANKLTSIAEAKMTQKKGAKAARQ